MKTRTGFVSNSSSSSFVVGYKGNHTVESAVRKALALPVGHPLCDLAKAVAQEMHWHAHSYDSVEDINREFAFFHLTPKEQELYQSLFDQGMTVAVGRLSDNDVGLEVTLTGLPAFTVSMDDVYVHKNFRDM